MPGAGPPPQRMASVFCSDPDAAADMMTRQSLCALEGIHKTHTPTHTKQTQTQSQSQRHQHTDMHQTKLQSHTPIPCRHYRDVRVTPHFETGKIPSCRGMRTPRTEVDRKAHTVAGNSDTKWGFAIGDAAAQSCTGAGASVDVGMYTHIYICIVTPPRGTGENNKHGRVNAHKPTCRATPHMHAS